MLVTTTGRCLLLKGDGATPEESVAMARAAYVVLRDAVAFLPWKIRR